MPLQLFVTCLSGTLWLVCTTQQRLPGKTGGESAERRGNARLAGEVASCSLGIWLGINKCGCVGEIAPRGESGLYSIIKYLITVSYRVSCCHIQRGSLGK